MFWCWVYNVLVWNKHALSVWNTCFRTVFWPRTSGNWLLYRLVRIVRCRLSRFDVLVTQVADIHPSTEHLVGCSRGTCSFLASDDFSLYTSWSFFLLGDGWEWDCAFFLNGFVVHDATQHYCEMCTRLCVQLHVRKLYEHNAACTELPGGWAVCTALTLEENKSIYSIVLCMQACFNLPVSLVHFILVVLFCLRHTTRNP